MTTNVYTDDFIEKEIHRVWAKRGNLHWKDASEIAKLVRDDTAAAKDAEIAALKAEVGRLALLVSIHFPDATLPPEARIDVE